MRGSAERDDGKKTPGSRHEGARQRLSESRRILDGHRVSAWSVLIQNNEGVFSGRGNGHLKTPLGKNHRTAMHCAAGRAGIIVRTVPPVTGHAVRDLRKGSFMAVGKRIPNQIPRERRQCQDRKQNSKEVVAQQCHECRDF